MSEQDERHDVKFNIGTGTVVCTCGAYFASQQYGLTMQRNAVSLWAEHLRDTESGPRPSKREVEACTCGIDPLDRMPLIDGRCPVHSPTPTNPTDPSDTDESE